MSLVLPFKFDAESIRNIFLLLFAFAFLFFIFLRGYSRIWSTTIRNYFISLTFIVIGTVSVLKSGTIDMHTLISTMTILIPAVLLMGAIGQLMGSILDNPKNREDADYKLDVLNALKKMDKTITLDELNEKLTKTVEEPDISEEEAEENAES